MAARFVTLIVSDVHLCGVLAPASGMPYRARANLPDRDLAALLDECAHAAGDAAYEVVLAGDFFDLDAASPDALAAASLPDPAHRDAPGASALMASILDDHPAVVAALGRALAAGAALVFVPGNHDAHIAFPGVRRAIASRLADAAVASGAREPLEELRARVRFRAWLHVTPSHLIVEHGHAYDPLVALPAMLPAAGAGLAHTVGSVASHYASAVFGATDLHATHPAPLSLPRMLAAARARAALDPRAAPALLRLMRDVAALQRAPAVTAPLIECAARETGLAVPALREHAALFAPAAGASGLADDTPWEHGAFERSLRETMARVAKLHGARGVVTGHTHAPFEDRADGVAYANSGSWTSRASGAPHAGTFCWCEGDEKSVTVQTLAWPRGGVP